MPAGRPLIENDVILYFNRDNCFKNEKEMQNYLYDSLECFFENSININERIIKKEKEYKLSRTFSIKGIPNIRYDIYAETNNKEYIFELKNPSKTGSFSELRSGIVQCMTYKMYNPNAEIYLISSVWNQIIINLISFYSLDINFVLFNKDYTAKMVNTRKTNE
jgi:hypothetical protein